MHKYIVKLIIFKCFIKNSTDTIWKFCILRLIAVCIYFVTWENITFLPQIRPELVTAISRQRAEIFACNWSRSHQVSQAQCLHTMSCPHTPSVYVSETPPPVLPHSHKNRHHSPTNEDIEKRPGVF